MTNKEKLKAFLLELLKNKPKRFSVCQALVCAQYAQNQGIEREYMSIVLITWPMRLMLDQAMEEYAQHFGTRRSFPVYSASPGINSTEAFVSVANDSNASFWEGPYGQNRIKFVQNLVRWCDNKPWEQ